MSDFMAINKQIKFEINKYLTAILIYNLDWFQIRPELLKICFLLKVQINHSSFLGIKKALMVRLVKKKLL